MLSSAAALAVIAAVALGAGRDARAGISPTPVATERGQANSFTVERIADGFNRPTWAGAAPGDDALWVLEQPGRVLRLDGDKRTTEIDISDRVLLGAEQGLLGIAFHPDFTTNRRLFLHWSDRHGDTRVAEFKDGKPQRQLLFVDQPEENHNGGHIVFGPDGRLYLGLGDGGGAFDPDERAQDPRQKLGKLLSVNVDAPKPDWRVHLTGLRNPWRFSFDPAMGEVWIGDVGQDEIEEVNRVLLENDEPPKNLGWDAFEGNAKTEEDDFALDETGELVWPVAQYTHDDGCSVTGGYVYHGTKLPKLSGRYLYGDFCSGVLWSLKPAPKGLATDVRREQAQVPQLAHIGPDAEGEPVFVSAAGALYRAR
ncbi:MAG TPA: PQQ-dependent sugar dehydrogenase [Solirubrobacter sp.]|nr:PQQ-dependent sugar dehydrogenase [Solirubrobacter sp.]